MGGSNCDESTDQNTQLQIQVETLSPMVLSDSPTVLMGGSTIVTIATDSDTLDGLNCSTDEIAKWNGSAGFVPQTTLVVDPAVDYHTRPCINARRHRSQLPNVTMQMTS